MKYVCILFMQTSDEGCTLNRCPLEVIEVADRAEFEVVAAQHPNKDPHFMRVVQP